MGILESEMLKDGCFINAQDARAEILAHIDSYCNTQCKHSSLGNFPLIIFKQQLTNRTKTTEAA